jgi:Fe-S-cluster containining protein
LCCHDGNITSTVIFSFYEKEFIEKNEKVKLKTISLKDEKNGEKLEILKGTLESKCPLFNKGKCSIYNSAPIYCRIYPYDIFCDPKGFYLGKYTSCPIKADKEDLKKVKKLCLDLLNAAPKNYWSLMETISKPLFSREKHEIISFLKKIK